MIPANLVTIAREIPLADAPKLMGALAEATAILQVRIATPTLASATQPEPEAEADEWITAEEAAPRLGLTVTQLKRRRGLPFRKKHGPRTVRYSTRGIAKYLRTRAA